MILNPSPTLTLFRFRTKISEVAGNSGRYQRLVMKDFKFRSNAQLAIYNNRKRPRRLWWMLPLTIVAAAGLYWSLQGNGGDYTPELAVSQEREGPISLPLALPGASPVDAKTTPQEPQTLAVKPPQAKIPVTQAKEPLEIPENAPAVVEPVIAETPPLAPKPEIDSGPKSNTLTYTIKPGDSLARIFRELGLSASLLHRIVNSGKPAKQLSHIKPGQILHIHRDQDNNFSELIYEIDPAKTLRVKLQEDRFISKLEQREVETRRAEASGIIESSLFGSAQKAGLSDALTLKLAEIFGWDIDFALEIRSGDRFSVIYEEQWLDGVKLRDGLIMAAEFTNRGKTYRAVRFEHSNGEADYYTPEGKRMKKTFLRTPVKFSRISSRFTKRRWHPVLKRWRSHKGVDYAAPTGTPVRAAGNGRIAFVGRKGGYGKVIFIKHQGSYTTVYGHLSRYAKGIRNGTKVSQGQLIGYVGSTGLATGPHLHYEFRIKGEHKDPLKVTFAPATPIEKKYIPAFKKATKPLLAKLDNLSRTLVADAL